MLWFCGQGGNILRIFRGQTGIRPHAPPGSACQHSATGTCHLRNVFIFSQSLARFPPHSLRAGRGGQEREGKGHSREQGGLENALLRALCAKKTPGVLPNPPATRPDATPRGSPNPLTVPQEVPSLPDPWPMRATSNQGPNMQRELHPPGPARKPRSKDARVRAELSWAPPPANSKPLKSVFIFIDHGSKAPATVSPGSLAYL